MIDTAISAGDLAPDVKAHRGMDAADPVGGKKNRLFQPLHPFGMGPGRTPQTAQVEHLGPQRGHDRRIVQLGVMGQRHHGGAAVQSDRGQRLRRANPPISADRGPLRRAEDRARVDQRHVIAAGFRHRNKGLAMWTAPTTIHPQGRIVDRDKAAGVLFDARAVGAEPRVVIGETPARGGGPPSCRSLTSATGARAARAATRSASSASGRLAPTTSTSTRIRPPQARPIGEGIVVADAEIQQPGRAVAPPASRALRRSTRPPTPGAARNRALHGARFPARSITSMAPTGRGRACPRFRRPWPARGPPRPAPPGANPAPGRADRTDSDMAGLP